MTDMRTDFQASLIEHLDFAPPCRYDEAHAPAKWAVWIVDRIICCNPPPPPHENPQFYCEACVERLRRNAKCPYCGTSVGSLTDISTHIERIGA